MENKKIVYLVSEYPGISHTFIFREIQFLRKYGFNVLTASIRIPEHLGKMTNAEHKDSRETIYIKKESIPKIIKSHFTLLTKSLYKYLSMFKYAVLLSLKNHLLVFKSLAYFIEAGILLDWMKKNNVSHVHVHFANPASTVAMVAASYKSITYSISVHGPDIFYNVDSNLLADKIKNAEFIRCISHYCQSQLMRLVSQNHWNKLHIVRCGIDSEVYTPRIEPVNEKAELLCVGRLVPAKGQHILLNACAKLKENGISFNLTFVGDGEDRSSLELSVKQLNISQHVTFTGAVGQNDVPIYYDKANIFVLPSFAEGVPVVLMEAMSKEIVSISTRITGIPELIENEKDGLLVTPSNIDELAEQIERVIKDVPLRTKLAKTGRKKILEKYDLNKNVKELAKLFDTEI